MRAVSYLISHSDQLMTLDLDPEDSMKDLAGYKPRHIYQLPTSIESSSKPIFSMPHHEVEAMRLELMDIMNFCPPSEPTAPNHTSTLFSSSLQLHDSTSPLSLILTIMGSFHSINTSCDLLFENSGLTDSSEDEENWKVKFDRSGGGDAFHSPSSLSSYFSEMGRSEISIPFLQFLSSFVVSTFFCNQVMKDKTSTSGRPMPSGRPLMTNGRPRPTGRDLYGADEEKKSDPEKEDEQEDDDGFFVVGTLEDLTSEDINGEEDDGEGKSKKEEEEEEEEEVYLIDPTTHLWIVGVLCLYPHTMTIWRLMNSGIPSMIKQVFFK